MAAQRNTTLMGMSILAIILLFSLVWFTNSKMSSRAFFSTEWTDRGSEVIMPGKNLQELMPDVEGVNGVNGSSMDSGQGSKAEGAAGSEHSVEGMEIDAEMKGEGGDSVGDQDEASEEGDEIPDYEEDGEEEEEVEVEVDKEAYLPENDKEEQTVHQHTNRIPRPTKETYKHLTTDDIDQMLNEPAGLHGFQNKSGMLDPFQWMYKTKNQRKSKIKKWLVQTVSLDNQDAPVQPPVQWPGCLVHVNHHYKFVWIKGKKVGGTSLRQNLGWICKDYWGVPKGTDMRYCSERVYKNSTTWISHAKKWWKDYFVFSIVRNPYTRFASSFTYINKLTPRCPSADFTSVCQDPFLQAKTCGMLQCCYNGAIEHHVHHMMEQSSCLFTADGKMAVDFIGHTETLTEDFQTIATEVNKRRRNGVPKLNENALVKEKNTNKKAKDNYALDLFTKHPKCLLEVQKHFEVDFRRLGYEE